MEFERGPNARTEGYSISGSHAKSVALNCGGTLSGGKRFSVSGPVRTGSGAAARQAKVATIKSILAAKGVTFVEAVDADCFTGMDHEVFLRRVQVCANAIIPKGYLPIARRFNAGIDRTF